MKRSAIGLDAVLEWKNLLNAFYQAARGKRQQKDVSAFSHHLDRELTSLRESVISGGYTPFKMTCFNIFDPKHRVIFAPAFRDRVLHHALMAKIGPVLERALVFDTYACREGKGTLAAVKRCQYHMGRFAWYAKIDVTAYFANVDHAVLKHLIRRRLKHPAVLNLIDIIIDSYCVTPGKGLPIGALISQYFANSYLSGVDRALLEHFGAGAMVRYMDDVMWWGESKAEVVAVFHEVQTYLKECLLLSIKPNVQINKSIHGVTYCGYRVFPNVLRLTQRKKRRYALRRRYWEDQYKLGRVDENGLQTGYASVHAVTVHAQSTAWRKEQLRRFPVSMGGVCD